MNLVLFLVFSILLYFVISKTNVEKKISNWIWVIGALIIFNLPKGQFEYIDNSYSKYIGVLMLLSMANALVIKSELLLKTRILQSIKMIIPLLFIFINGLNSDLALILAIVSYILLNSKAKDSVEQLVSYLIIGLSSIKYFVQMHYNSPLSVVNYVIFDIFEYLLIGLCLLTFFNTVNILNDWFKNKRRAVTNIFWPSLFIVSSLRLSAFDAIYTDYNIILAVILGIYVIRYWTKKQLIALFTGVTAMLFVSPALLLIPLGLMILAFWYEKFKKLSFQIKIEYLNLVSIITILFAIKYSIAPLGISTIVLFLYVIRDFNKEFEIE